MKTDNVVRLEAMDALLQVLGLFDAERFICMIKRDTFDYTEWRRDLWNGMTIEQIFAEASAQYENA